MRSYLTWLGGMAAIALAVHLGPRRERVVERIIEKPSLSGAIRAEQSFDAGQTWVSAAIVMKDGTVRADIPVARGVTSVRLIEATPPAFDQSGTQSVSGTLRVDVK